MSKIKEDVSIARGGIYKSIKCGYSYGVVARDDAMDIIVVALTIHGRDPSVYVDYSSMSVWKISTFYDYFKAV